jgi:GNAT superfamily N-acetyltransferase
MAVFDPAATLQIETLVPHHAEAVAHLSVEAGWNQVAADWRLMIERGRAFGVRAPSGQWIATALVLPLGPAISWISMVLVTAPARRQGLGTRLLARCLDEIANSGVVAGLDATEFGRPVYLPLGFRDVYPLSRWRLEPGTRGRIDPPKGIRIRPGAAQDLPSIIACDEARSGFNRGPVLEHLLSRAPSVAHVAERADGALAGYALGRNGHAALHIGPIVADDEAIAVALLASAVSDSDQRVILDVPDRHRQLRDWLAAQGGIAPRAFMRMLQGTFPPVEDATHVFALAGPELA